MSNVRIEYNFLLESGELFDVVYGMVGNWRSDEARFTRYYEQNLNALNNITVNFEELYGYEEEGNDL